MDDIFGGMLNNPNFGKVFRGSSHFRAAFQQMVSMSVDPNVASLRQKLKIDVDRDGKLQLVSKDLGYTWTRGNGENTGDFLSRVMHGRKMGPSSAGVAEDIFDPVAGFGLGNVRTSELIAGGQLGKGRRELRSIAERSNANILFRTFDPGAQSLASVYQNLTDPDTGQVLGLVTADTDKIRVAQMFDKTTGDPYSHSRIIQELGLDPDDTNFGKRVRALFNNTQVSVGFKPRELNIAQMDTMLMLGADPIAMTKARNRAKREKMFNPTLDIDERVREIIATETDGLNFQSKTASKRLIARYSKDVDEMQAALNAKAGKISAAEFNAEQRAINSFKTEIEQIRANIGEGNAFNLRAFGDTTEGAQYVKGDIMVLEDQVFRDMARRANPKYAGLTDEQIDLIDILASESKSDIGIMAGRAGRVTMDPVGRVGAAHSNVLSMANFGDLYNPELPGGGTLLERSLRDSLSDAMSKIRSGDISPLRAIAGQLENLRIEDFDDPSMYYEAVNRREFIQRVENFVQSGNRLDLSPSMTKESLRLIREHSFQQRKFGGTINFRGQEVTDLRLRMEIPGSIDAHGVATQVLRDQHPYLTAAQAAEVNISESIIARPGMTIIPPSADVNRFRFSDFDIDKAYDALGGPDLDDRFVASFTYDPEARRAVAMLTRDPNALTEYVHFDVDLALDKRFANKTIDATSAARIQVPRGPGGQVKLYDLSIRQKQINMRLESLARGGEWSKIGKKKQQEINRLFNERDEINDLMHSFYSSSESGLVQDRLSRRYARSADTGLRGTYAPAGFETTDESLARWVSGSGIRGYASQRGMSAQEKFASFTREIDEMMNDETAMPYEYRGRNFNEIFEGGRSQLYADANVTTNLQELLREAKAKGSQPLTEAALRERNFAVSKAQGLLGRTVNVSTTIDQFMESTIRGGALSPAQIQQFKDLVEKEGRITRIAREQVIDQIRKTGDPRFIELIESVLNENLHKMGRILGGMQGLGVDPALLGQRLDADLAQVAKGYSSAVGRTVKADELGRLLALDPSDPRSSIGKVYDRVLGMRDEFDVEMDEMVQETNQRVLNEIQESGFEATDLENERARQFLGGFVEDQRELATAFRNEDDLQDLLETALRVGGEDTDDLYELLGEYTREEINMRSVRRLEGWGLLDDRAAMNRQLVAARRMAAEMDVNAGMLSAGRALEQTSTAQPVASIGRMMDEAMATEVLDAGVRRELFTAAQMFDPNVHDIGRFMHEVIRGTISADELRFSSQFSKQQTMAEIVQMLEGRGGERNAREIAGIARRMGVAADTDLEDLVNMQGPRSGSLWDQIDTTVQPGAVRAARRAVSDETAEEVLAPIAQTAMRRLDMAELSNLLSKPGFRKGMGAAAIFAGLGLLHEMRGDRTPEEMAGPPLLPGGSSYESYEGFDPNSIYSSVQSPTFGQMGQGTTYKIRANGSFDAYALGTQASALTGGTFDSTIYKGRKTVNYPGATSADILNSRSG